MTARRSTGIDSLDEELGGGLTPGHIVCLRTAAGSQGERLLRELAVNLESLYLSTTRTDEAVAEWLGADSNGVEVRYSGIDGLTPRGGEAVRRFVRDAAGWTDDGAVDTADEQVQLDALSAAIDGWEGSVVIDPVNPIESAPEPAYMSFLQGLQRRLQGTGSLGFLHVVEAATDPPGRWLTLQLADEVWDLDVEITNLQVDFILTVTKSRSDHVPGKQIKLYLGEDVAVDPSRNIS